MYALELEVKRIICLLCLIFISFPLMLAIAAFNRLKRLLNLFDAIVLMFDRNEAHIFISSVRCCAYQKREKLLKSNVTF